MWRSQSEKFSADVAKLNTNTVAYLESLSIAVRGMATEWRSYALLNSGRIEPFLEAKLASWAGERTGAEILRSFSADLFAIEQALSKLAPLDARILTLPENVEDSARSQLLAQKLSPAPPENQHDGALGMLSAYLTAREQLGFARRRQEALAAIADLAATNRAGAVQEFFLHAQSQMITVCNVVDMSASAIVRAAKSRR